MEAIGDSVLVDCLNQTKDKNSVEFERNLDEFKKTLEDEENRLIQLEESRSKLQKEIDEMYQEILEEKKSYRKAIDCVISEREKYSRSILDSYSQSVDLSPVTSSLSLFDTDSNKLEINIDTDIEKIRCDLMENYITTKEEYLITIKDHIQQKKKKLEEVESL